LSVFTFITVFFDLANAILLTSVIILLLVNKYYVEGSSVQATPENTLKSSISGTIA
jgi:hypothetical protein